MTGRGRRHHHAAQRDEYSKAEVAARGLACPFAKSNPETYVNADVCRPGEGFKETRLLLYVQWYPPAHSSRQAGPGPSPPRS